MGVFLNIDCMEGMKQYPDKYFDLAIVDPPYGIGVQSMGFTKTGNRKSSKGSKAKSRDYRRDEEWDIAPTEDYFKELKRISKNFIIWGAIISQSIFLLQRVSSSGIKDARMICETISPIANLHIFPRD